MVRRRGARRSSLDARRDFEDSIGGSPFGGRSAAAPGVQSVPGYAYPTTGDVHAVSKKLLEVTPEALEEKRRQLEKKEEASSARRLIEREAKAENWK